MTKRLSFPGSRTKTGKTFNIAITPAVRRVLNAAPKGGKYVCNGLGVPFSGFSKLKDRLPALSRPWTYHDLRRTFSTRLAALGVKQEVIDACTGHKAGTINKPTIATVTATKCARRGSCGRDTLTS